MRFLTTDLFDDMDRFLTGADIRRSRLQSETELFSPVCEISETETHFLMSLDIPGLKKEDIKIETNQNILTISGSRHRESTADKNMKVQRMERSYGSFKRSFTLPQNVDADSIEAHYENGVLELSLPKIELAQSRQIEIQTGKGGLFDRLLGKSKDTSDKRASLS